MATEKYQPETGNIEELSKSEGLLADIDLRIMEDYPDLVREAESKGWDLEAILPFLRRAYAHGRLDERNGDPDPDKFYASHGYNIPPKREVVGDRPEFYNQEERGV